MEKDEIIRSTWSEEKRKAWEKKWEEHAQEVWMGEPFTAPCAKCRWRRRDRVPEVDTCDMFPDKDGSGFDTKSEEIMYGGKKCPYFRPEK